MLVLAADVRHIYPTPGLHLSERVHTGMCGARKNGLGPLRGPELAPKFKLKLEGGAARAPAVAAATL